MGTMAQKVDNRDQKFADSTVPSPGATAVGIVIFVVIAIAVVVVVSVALGTALVGIVHVVAGWVKLSESHILVATIAVILTIVFAVVTMALLSSLSDIRLSLNPGPGSSYGPIGRLVAQNALKVGGDVAAPAPKRRRAPRKPVE